MSILEVTPSGYCRGVALALSKVRKAIKDYPDQPIYIIGMIVHNRYIVDAFRMHNVVTLDDSTLSKMELVNQIESGVVIFTAHGIADEVKQRAIDKGLTVIDATCDYVLKTHDIIKEHLNEGYTVFYIGKKKHPESEAALSIDENIILVTGVEDVDSINCSNSKILITNQTTMSIFETQDIINAITARFPKAVIAEEICDATKRRQQAVADLKDIDTLIVVGDPKSNNTNQLARMGLKSGIKKVLRIETAKDLENVKFDDTERIAVASGASTPKVLTDNVINYLQSGNTDYLTVDLSSIIRFL
ncbi:MAG: 4-hydroxy-3-methylbut-2-enyl diphosphate reductase [Erysipelotrichaceae bacterium]|nr:4-hydroxy-3-methylbut-2-enyl diphosphate reductase [Erysipelotrichaceae bacterium]